MEINKGCALEQRGGLYNDEVRRIISIRAFLSKRTCVEKDGPNTHPLIHPEVGVHAAALVEIFNFLWRFR